MPLSQSHEFFLKNPVPDFWALIPYYLPQKTGASCSVVTVAMIVNAARSGQKLSADESLATESDLLEKVKNPA